MFVKFIRQQATTTFRLLTEMSLAQQIHASLTKPVSLRTARFEVFGQSNASSEMGGDVLDVVQTNGRLALFLGDVSGHGVRAGVVMGMVKSAIRMKLQSSHALDELLNDLNAVVGELAHPGMFVTFAAMQLDESDLARVVLAGHLPIMHYRAGDRTWSEIEADHPPLGVVPGETFRLFQVPYAPGDLFVVVTDGLMEVFDRNGAPLGWQGIRRVLEDGAAERPLAEIAAHVFTTVRDFGPQVDDQSILLIRPL
jgi:serine phosphatase RsbU (regulator of sigma subunit)